MYFNNDLIKFGVNMVSKVNMFVKHYSFMFVCYPYIILVCRLGNEVFLPTCKTILTSPRPTKTIISQVLRNSLN